jgi:lysophospholipase L1-like esterase
MSGTEMYYPTVNSTIHARNHTMYSCNSESALVLESSNHPDNAREVLLTFDFTEFTGENTADARIVLHTVVESDALTPSVQVYGLDNRNTFEQTEINWDKLKSSLTYVTTTTLTKTLNGRSSYIVTDFVNAHMKDKKISFLLKLTDANGITQRVTYASSLEDPGQRPVLIIATKDKPSYVLNDIMEPFWASDTMLNESVIMVSQGDNLPEAPLLFNPLNILSVSNAQMTEEYEEGIDWVVDGRILRLTRDSRAQALTYEELHPSSPDAKPGVMKCYDGSYLVFGEGSWFHRQQLVVTYTHSGDQWEGPRLDFDPTKLPATIEKLRQKTPIKVMLLGDSISVGANASGFTGAPPYTPSWGELVAKQLEATYNTSVTYKNPSLGGTTVQWGEEVAPFFVTPEKPDLLMIAFGMNGRASAEEYLQSIKAIMDSVRRNNPATEFILVAPMQANQRWRPLGPQASYLSALLTLEKQGIAVADMWSVHRELLKHKLYWDMTGNHVNHPNDFLTRVYAQVVASLLIPYR